MTMLKNSPRIVQVRVNVSERTVDVTVKRIQKETSAYAGRTYTLKVASERAKRLHRLLPEPNRDNILWRQGIMVYNC